MTTEAAPRITPGFSMTQTERDALEYARSIPYRPDHPTDHDTRETAESFLTACRDVGLRMEASSDADNLIHLCFLNGDYTRLDSIIAEQRKIIDSMITRANK